MKKLRWACLRGLRELDELLLSYLELNYNKADEQEKNAFKSLLDMDNITLIDLFFHNLSIEDRQTADLIAKIKNKK